MNGSSWAIQDVLTSGPGPNSKRLNLRTSMSNAKTAAKVLAASLVSGSSLRTETQYYSINREGKRALVHLNHARDVDDSGIAIQSDSGFASSGGLSSDGSSSAVINLVEYLIKPTGIRLRALGAAISLACVDAEVFAQPSFAVRNTNMGGKFLWGIAAGPSGIVAVGEGGVILSSPNGTNWVRRSSGVSDWLVGVVHGAGYYVAVGERGRVLLSTDGTLWENVRQSVTIARLNNIIFAEGKFVAVGESGTIITSPDARTWTLRRSGVTTWLRGLAYRTTPATISPTLINNNTSQFFAAGENGVLVGSRDGESWGPMLARDFFTPSTVLRSDIEAMTSQPLAGIGADGALLSAFSYTDVGKTPVVGNLTQVTITNSWLLLSVGIRERFRGLARGANALFAVGEGGVIAISGNGYSGWERLESGTTASLTNGAYVGNSLIVVGENETILQSTPFYNSRLLNLSTRGQVGVGENRLISGFVVTGAAPKKMLLRAVGPGLGRFGVTGALAGPALSLHDDSGRVIASNAGWGTSPEAGAIANAALEVGAFAFAAGSADSALLVSLTAGNYTLQVSGVDGSSGVALAEAYDVDGLSTDTSRAVNISTRGFVGGGSNALIAGFHIGGTSSRRVMVRAVGPTLGSLRVANALAEPRVEIYTSSGGRYSYFDLDGSFQVADSTAFARPAMWSARANADQVRGAAYSVGAFALLEDSKDAVLLVTLPAGTYTAVVNGLNNTAGVALVEVYDLP
jgi:hypothetical protein